MSRCCPDVCKVLQPLCDNKTCQEDNGPGSCVYPNLYLSDCKPMPTPRPTAVEFTVEMGALGENEKNRCKSRLANYANITCPKLVDKNSWTSKDGNGNIKGSDEFSITVTGSMVTASRLDGPGNAGWGLDLNFTCTGSPVIHKNREIFTVEVGKSVFKYKTNLIPYRDVVCPRNVNQTNWLNREVWPDMFKVVGTENRVITSREKSWDLVLKFECTGVPDTKTKFTATVGSSKTNKTTTWQASKYKDIVCPKNVNKENWEGGKTYPDVFKIAVAGNNITASRNKSWDMDLQFYCYGVS